MPSMARPAPRPFRKIAMRKQTGVSKPVGVNAMPSVLGKKITPATKTKPHAATEGPASKPSAKPLHAVET